MEALAEVVFKDVAKALGQFHNRICEASLYDWKSCFWNDRTRRRNPLPRIADLAGQEELAELEVEIGTGAFLVIDQALSHPPKEIELRWGSFDYATLLRRGLRKILNQTDVPGSEKARVYGSPSSMGEGHTSAFETPDCAKCKGYTKCAISYA